MNQPEVMRLADALDELDAQFSRSGLCGEAAAELRRLHEIATAYEVVRKERDEAKDEAYQLREQNNSLDEACAKLERERDRNLDTINMDNNIILKYRALNAELVEALKVALLQNEHDMVMTGDECRKARAALAKLESRP